MNVYKITPTVDYACGVALVAAFDKEQAINVFCNTDEYQDFEYQDFECTISYISNLVYTGSKPTLILDSLTCN